MKFHLTLTFLTFLLSTSKAVKRNQRAKRCENPVPGIAFDIDGVVRQGNRPCLEGLAAVVDVQSKNWPFVFLTNGGTGRTEEEYAIKLTKMFMSDKVRKCTGIFNDTPEAKIKDQQLAAKLQKKLRPLTGDQFILAYSPLVDFHQMKDKNVLTIGAAGVERVARAYGFSKVIHANEYARRHPDQSPWYTNWVGETPPGCLGLRGDEAEMHGTGNFTTYEQIDAIFVMSEPNFFGQALELAVDFLLSTNPIEIEIEDVQPYIVFANPDLLWKAEFPRSRLGLGAFKISLEAVLRARLKEMGMSDAAIAARRNERWIQLGKPMPDQYHFAERKMDLLLSQMIDKDDATTCIGKFYMIGDNHNTDIKGATATNNMVLSDNSKNRMRNWAGILVKTGVWEPGYQTHGATVIKDNAKQAIDWIIDQQPTERKRERKRLTSGDDL